MGASPPQTSAGPSASDSEEHAPRRWLWVVAATCLVALGIGAVIGYSLTRDTHVGRGTTGNALAPEPGPTTPVDRVAAPAPEGDAALETAPDDEGTSTQTLA